LVFGVTLNYFSYILKKIERKFLRWIEALMAKRFTYRHPNRIETLLIKICGLLVKRMIPNDRWSLNVHAKQLASASILPCDRYYSFGKKIALFVCYRGEFSTGIALASMLAWRGHKVTILYLPKLQSPSKSPLEDGLDAGVYLERSLRWVEIVSKGRINCVDISKNININIDIYKKISYLERRAHLDSVMALRRELLEPNDPLVVTYIKHYLELGKLVQKSMLTLIDKSTYDLFLVPNGSTYAAAHVVDVLKEYKKPFVCFDKFSMRNSKLINHNGNIMELNDIDAIWSRILKLGLINDAQIKQCCTRAMGMLNERRYGAVENWATQTQTKKSVGAANVKKIIGLKPSESFLLIATNVPFDAGLAEITTIFPSMREWLIETIKYVKKSNYVRIVVKTHPDESRWAANETVEDIFKNLNDDIKNNIIIVNSSEINTYDLIEASNCGIVFSSTVGLEMAMLGKPVLLGSRVYYAGKGFTIDVNDKDEYFLKLSALIANFNQFAVSNDTIYMSQIYHYLLHYAVQWPFPFMKPSDISNYRLHQLLSGDGISKYIQTLDSLCVGDTNSVVNMIVKKQQWDLPLTVVSA